VKRRSKKLNNLFIVSYLLAYGTLINLSAKADGPSLNDFFSIEGAQSCQGGAETMAQRGAAVGNNNSTSITREQ